MKECKTQGIKTDKSKVENALQKIMDFFFLGKSQKGKKCTKSTTSKFIPVKVDAIPCEVTENIVHFSDGRLCDEPLVISCDDASVTDISEGTKEPCLIVPASDLNSSDFAKELGNILLEEKCYIFFGTSGLSKQGKEKA